MRQLFLIVVLIAASFVGGAFVNGPGLQWAQSRLLRSLGLNQGGEIASVELKPVTSSDPDVQTNSSESTATKPAADSPQVRYSWHHHFRRKLNPQSMMHPINPRHWPTSLS